MLKGRPGSLSVPSFSFRFNPSEEDELEEVADDAKPDSVEVGRDVARERSNSSPPSPPPAQQQQPPATAQRSTTTGKPANMSPTTFRMAMLSKGKRTFSLDGESNLPEVSAGVTSATTSSSSSDTWSILSELKEKITRTVEERFRFDLHTGAGGGASTASKSGSGAGAVDVKTTAEVVMAKENATNESKEKLVDVKPRSLGGTPETVRRSSSDTVIFGSDVQLRHRRVISPPDPAPPDDTLQATSKFAESRTADDLDDEFWPGHCWTTTTATKSETGSSTSTMPSASPPQADGGTSSLSSSGYHQCRFLPPSLRRLLQPLTPFKKSLSVIGLLLLVYQFLPVPAFLDGLLTGVTITASLIWTWHWFTKARGHRRHDQAFVGLPADDAAALSSISTSKVTGNIRKVWMNEYLGTYSPEDFHIGHTHSVLVRLEGSTLRISYSKSPIPKRSMWNEVTPKQIFIHQRHYDMCGAKLSLLPEGLAKRRHWSRRYPICVEVKQFSKPADPTSPPHLLKENENLVVLFARSGREKEEWYWRLEAATGKRVYGSATDSSCTSSSSMSADRGATKLLLNYGVYMARLIPSPVRESSAVATTTATTSTDVSYTPPISPKKEALLAAAAAAAAASAASSSSSFLSEGALNLDGRLQNVAWLNAVLGRCFWDFLREAQWADRVRQRIQRKLATIKVPYFIEELRVSDIELGSQLPQVTSISTPIVDERGLWVDVGVSYYGALRMTLATKLNLMRLKRMAGGSGGAGVGAGVGNSGSADPLDAISDAQPNLSASGAADSSKYFSSFYDSDADESVESSSDEEGEQRVADGLSAEQDGGGGNTNSGTPSSQSGRRTSRTLLRLVDTITQSRYFQHATEYKYIKKAMEGVSNTPLVLTVELLTLSGTVAVNIPPPPSDRLWYGFRGNPQLSVVAKPKVGEREVQFTHIVEWIEKKLVLEFQRFLVLPNMDDLIIPIANSGIVQFSTPRDDSPQTPPFSHKQ